MEEELRLKKYCDGREVATKATTTKILNIGESAMEETTIVEEKSSKKDSSVDHGNELVTIKNTLVKTIIVF